MKLPYEEAIVNGIKGFFQIDEDNTITMPLSMLTLLKFKKGLKEKKKFWNTTRQFNAPEREPQVGRKLFGVRLLVFNFKF